MYFGCILIITHRGKTTPNFNTKKGKRNLRDFSEKTWEKITQFYSLSQQGIVIFSNSSGRIINGLKLRHAIAIS